MHNSLLYSFIIWTAVLLLVDVIFIVRARSVLSRILAADLLTLILAAVLVIFTYSTGEAWYLDVALLLALIAFVGTLAAVRFYSDGRLF